MKKTVQLFASVICFALSSASTFAAPSYWDLDGATPGAGSIAGVATGTWDGINTFWNADSGGAGSGTAAWTGGDTAVFSAGTDASGTFTVTVTGTQTAAGVTVEEGTVTLSGGGISMDVVGGGTIDIGSGLTTVISSVISGGANNQTLTKNGSGLVSLTGPNTYTGVTTVNLGTLQVGSGTALGTTAGNTVVNSGGAVLITATPIAEPITINGTGVGGTGALRSTGARTYSGSITLGSSGAMIAATSGTLTITGAITDGGNNYNLTLGGAGNIRLNTGTLNIGTGIITKEGTGSIQSEASWTAGGVVVNDGKLIIRNLFGSGAGTLTFNSGADEFGNNTFTGAPTTPLDVVNPITLNHSALPIVTRTATTFTMSGAVTGGGGLDIKAVGTGVVILNNNDTYGGNTTITTGTLQLGASGAIPNTPIINVVSGATFDVSLVSFTLGASQTLKGGGNVTGNVTANGTIAPGASAGTLPVSGDLNLASSAVLSYELNGGNTTVGGGINDLTTVGGALTLDGTLNVSELVAGSFLSANLGDKWRLFNYTNPSLVDNGLTLGSMPAVAGATWYLELDTATSGQVNLVLVPEPSTVVLGLLGGLGMLLVIRRRRLA